MYTMIIVAIMASRGVQTQVIEDKVYVTGRPGCTVEALGGDVKNPVIYCKR